MRRVFFDIDSLKGGQDFAVELNNAISSSRVFVAVVSNDWVGEGVVGKRKIDAPNDFVRRELSAALLQGVTVVPVLIDNAKMPGAGELPDDIKEFSSKNFVLLRFESNKSDLRVLKRHVAFSLRGKWRWQARGGLIAASASIVLFSLIGGGLLRYLAGQNEAGARYETHIDSENGAWQAALQQDSVNGYEVFLSGFPNSRRSEEARRRLEDVNRRAAEAGDWRAANVAMTRLAMEHYLRKWPQGQFANEARSSMANLDKLATKWNELRSQRSPERIRQFVVDSHGTGFAAEAEARLREVTESDKMAWQRAEASRLRAAYEAYLGEWSEGDFRGKGEERIRDINDGIAEWKMLNKNNQGDLKKFIEKYAWSPEIVGEAYVQMEVLSRGGSSSYIRKLKAIEIYEKLSGKVVRLSETGEWIRFRQASAFRERLKLERDWYATNGSYRAEFEGEFEASAKLNGRMVSIEGIALLQASSSGDVGTLILYQVRGADRTKKDFVNGDRLYSMVQFIYGPHGYVCVGAAWSFASNSKPNQLNQACAIE